MAKQSNAIRIGILGASGYTGAELLRYSEIQTQQPAVGTGTGVLGDRKKLSVGSDAGTYIAFDCHRPPIIETFDMRAIWRHWRLA